MSTEQQHREARADELLAIRCQLGERAAFDALISRWHEPLWRYLRRLANDEDAARDLAQDTWMRVLRGISGLRDPARLRAWLFGIAHRVAMDRLRTHYARGPHDDFALDELPAHEPDANLEAELATLESGVAALPFIEREVVTLFYLRELTLAQIAEASGVPEGTVKSRLFRARNLLRRSIEIGETNELA